MTDQQHPPRDRAAEARERVRAALREAGAKQTNAVERLRMEPQREEAGGLFDAGFRYERE